MDKHCGQVDKAGKPYISHLLRVANKFKDKKKYIVSILHDIIEDTDITAEYLLNEGFPKEIVDAIVALTRQPDELYPDFINRCSLNKIGRQVKIRDLEDNMDITRLTKLSKTDVDRLNKYLQAYHLLTRN